jgi:hypothetical protein
MKTRLRFGLALFLVLLAVAWPARAQDQSQPGPVPKQISQFYEDYTFVSSFSTPQERATLAGYLTTPGQTYKSKDGRLEKVLQLMKKLKAQVNNIDPKMVINPYHRLERVDYEGVVEVNHVGVCGDRATVDVTILGLKPETNLWLIAQYEKSSGDSTTIPSPEKGLERAKGSTFRRAETHTWVKINGEWKKNEVNIILLK